MKLESLRQNVILRWQQSPELRSLSENIVEWRCVLNFGILGYYRHARIFPISNLCSSTDLRVVWKVISSGVLDKIHWDNDQNVLMSCHQPRSAVTAIILSLNFVTCQYSKQFLEVKNWNIPNVQLFRFNFFVSRLCLKYSDHDWICHGENELDKPSGQHKWTNINWLRSCIKKHQNNIKKHQNNIKKLLVNFEITLR